MSQNIQAYNTFGISSLAKEIVFIKDVKALRSTIKQYPNYKVLGGGSNVLLKGDLSDTVLLKIEIGGIKIEREFEQVVYVSAGAGIVWHDLVIHTIDKGLGGLENLSLIPGTVGASPIQNIGAYGVEIKDVFHKLKALEVATGKVKTFYKKDCVFGYRDSVFKGIAKGKYIIVQVWFKLNKAVHSLKLNYGAIRQALEERGISTPTIKDVSDAVISIRESKLPNPKEIGNSGSFFKNPVISVPLFEELKAKYENIPNYPQADGNIKLAAGWLIEKCGWKGIRRGDAGVHAKQALVLVNYGKASGEEIFMLAKEIQASVVEKFNIKLEMEVNVWG